MQNSKRRESWSLVGTELAFLLGWLRCFCLCRLPWTRSFPLESSYSRIHSVMQGQWTTWRSARVWSKTLPSSLIRSARWGYRWRDLDSARIIASLRSDEMLDLRSWLRFYDRGQGWRCVDPHCRGRRQIVIPLALKGQFRPSLHKLLSLGRHWRQPIWLGIAGAFDTALITRRFLHRTSGPEEIDLNLLFGAVVCVWR